MRSSPGPRAIVLLLALSGCPAKDGGASEPGTSETESTSTAAPTGETTVDPTGGPDTTSAADTDTDTDTGEPTFIDLFACEVPEVCEKISLHIDPEPPEALECAAQLIVSKQPGLIRALLTPGPDIDETDSFIFVLGDGTALVQTRERHCDDLEANCDFDTLPWEPSSAHQICDLMFTEDLAESCGCAMEPCSGCNWSPFFNALANCEPVAEFTCAAVLSLLDSKG